MCTGLKRLVGNSRIFVYKCGSRLEQLLQRETEEEREEETHTSPADKDLIVVRSTGAEEPLRLKEVRLGKGGRAARKEGPAEPTASSKLQLCRNYRDERIVQRRMRDTIVRVPPVSCPVRAPFHRLRPCGGMASSAG